MLGSIGDLSIIELFLKQIGKSPEVKKSQQSSTNIKTERSYSRYQKAITHTLLSFPNKNVESLIRTAINTESITKDTLLLLFWNASYNNELLRYLNLNVFFPALYSGRAMLRNDEVVACLKELKQLEPSLQKWTEKTITTTASKYLTLLKKFNLLEGRINKTITHHHMSTKAFILFIYWLRAVDPKPNILSSEFLLYSFMETEILLKQSLLPLFKKWFQVTFTGDRLTISPTLSYEEVYHELIHS